MKFMKRTKNGFTLVEVLVGFLIITLAFMIMGTAFLSSVRTIKTGRTQNSATFEMKNLIEKEWVDTLELISAYGSYWDEAAGDWKIDPHAATTPKSTSDLLKRVESKYGKPLPKPSKDVYICCGMKVSGYSIKAEPVPGRAVYSFVSDKHTETELPAIESASIEGGPRFQYLYDPSARLSFRGTHGNVINNHLLYMIQNKWYVTNPMVFPEGSSEEALLAKSYLDFSGLSVTRTPRFSSDYRRLGEKKNTFTVNPHEPMFRDAAIKFSVVPLGLNKYVGHEVESENSKYFIGLPLESYPLLAHYNADLVMNYDQLNDKVISELGSFAADPDGNYWFDVRKYIKHSGLGNPNPFAFSGCELRKSDMGDYVSFTKDAEGVLKEKDGTLFLRLRDLEYTSGKKIILLQSPKLEKVAADKGKKMFELSLENKKLMIYTREVVERPSGDPAVPPTYEIEETAQDLIADTYTDSSYSEVVTGTADQNAGFNVFALEFSGGAINKMTQFILKPHGGGYRAEPKSLTVPVLTASQFKPGDIEFATDGEGMAGISDVVMYKGAVSDAFAEKVGQYLLQRYFPQ